MFPKIFRNDAEFQIAGHQAITFQTEWSKAKIIAAIHKNGIASFVNEDFTPEPNVFSLKPRYNDGRIAGTAGIILKASCCAFTKEPGSWYLFPFHKAELAAVGLEEDDLIRYIKTLNDLKVGFKYLYFGEQEPPITANKYWMNGNKQSGLQAVDKARYPTNQFYWVAVPKFNTTKKTEQRNVPYLHWIYLRYLINCSSSLGNNVAGNVRKLSYYNIPRIMMSLIDDHNLSPMRAFLFTIAAAPWTSSWGLSYSDYGLDDKYRPDLGISAKQFKALLHCNTVGGSMNVMLTSDNNQSEAARNLKFTLNAKHSPAHTFKLVTEDKIAEFVEYMDKMYPEKATPSKAKLKAKKSGKGKKTTIRKRKAPINK